MKKETCASCAKDAVVWCQWGSDNFIQDASFCDEHAKDLWERIDPLLKLNKAWYRIDQMKAKVE